MGCWKKRFWRRCNDEAFYFGVIVVVGLHAPAPFPEAQRIEGYHSEFICLDEDSGELMGPLDGCGCHAWDAEAEGLSVWVASNVFARTMSAML